MKGGLVSFDVEMKTERKDAPIEGCEGTEAGLGVETLAESIGREET